MPSPLAPPGPGRSFSRSGVGVLAAHRSAMGNCAGSTSSYRIVAVEGAQAEPVSWIGKNEAQHHDAVEWGPPGKPSARELRRRYPSAITRSASIAI